MCFKPLRSSSTRNHNTRFKNSDHELVQCISGCSTKCSVYVFICLSTVLYSVVHMQSGEKWIVSAGRYTVQELQRQETLFGQSYKVSLNHALLSQKTIWMPHHLKTILWMPNLHWDRVSYRKLKDSPSILCNVTFSLEYVAIFIKDAEAVYSIFYSVTVKRINVQERLVML